MSVASAYQLLPSKGIAPWADMPYIGGPFTTKPSAASFTDAANYKISKWYMVGPRNVDWIRTALSKEHVVAISIPAYDNFFWLSPANALYGSAAGGVGGHEILAVGYNDVNQTIKIQNSWGTGWADNGYGYITDAWLNANMWDASYAEDVTPRPAPVSPLTNESAYPNGAPELSTLINTTKAGKASHTTHMLARISAARIAKMV